MLIVLFTLPDTLGADAECLILSIVEGDDCISFERDEMHCQVVQTTR
jgi:hypothetical protein